MTENIKAGADHHAGDGGYSESTREKYNEFAKGRNKSLAESRIRELATQAFVETNTALIQRLPVNFVERFAELIVAECLEACSRANEIRHFVPPTQEQVVLSCMREIQEHFGVE